MGLLIKSLKEEVNDTLICDFVNLVFDYGVENETIDKAELMNMFVFGIYYNCRDELNKNLRLSEKFTDLLDTIKYTGFGKFCLNDAVYIYSQLKPKEALEKMKYFLKKLNRNPNDKILNKYPEIKKLIQEEFKTKNSQ